MRRLTDRNEINYSYQPLTGWLWTITDALGQVKTQSYFLDEMNPRANQWHWPCQPIQKAKSMQRLGYETPFPIVAANRRGCANRENSCIGSELLGKRSGTMTAWSPLYSSERFNPRSTHSMSCLPPTTSALLASFSHA